MKMQDSTRLRHDFDAIGSFAKPEYGWDHNNHYHRYLLQFVPEHCGIAVDIGCGTGDFTRKLAVRSKRVVGYDLSPVSIMKAAEYSNEHTNIAYLTQDVMVTEFEDESVDCFTSIAVLHHLDMHALLPKLKKALKPNGVMAFLDLYRKSSLLEFVPELWALPLNQFYLWTKLKQMKSQEEIRAMEEHMKHDRYLSRSELRSVYSQHLPGHRLQTHLLWRYSLVWKKPAGQHGGEP